jgi:glutaredoxin
MKRLSIFFGFALIPVIVLGLLHPDRLLGGPSIGAELKYPASPGAEIVVFVRDGCPHCADFHEFALEQKWTVDYREVTQIDSQQMFQELQEHVPTLNQGVPTIILNGHVMQGYDTHETSGKRIAGLYEECLESSAGCLPYKDFIASSAIVELESAAEGTCTEDCDANLEKYIFNLWFIGEVDLTLLSLPMLSILLGFLDGFNPCAMWVLITLLTLLINTHDMKKVWVIGGTFLFVSGAVYYLFIAAWLNVFLLIGFNAIVQKVIGSVAILGGGFYLYEAFGKDPNQCKVTNMGRRQKTIAEMKRIMQISAWPAMILGVAILAVSVNMIELVCTAGLPAIFTQILAFNDVTNAARYGYIGLFILMYMIDDMIIFGIAIYTLHATGLTTKYRRFTLIFGGLLMYGLGLLLIFAPEVLTFS